MKGHFWKRTVAGCLALLLVSGSAPVQPVADLFNGLAIMASAETAVTYIDGDGIEKTCTEYTVLTGNESGTLAPGWYLVNSDITYLNKLVFDLGDVHIILADDCTMNLGTAEQKISGYGIENRHDEGWEDTLVIHGQSGGTGTLNIYSSNYCVYSKTGYVQNGGIVNLVSDKTGIYSSGDFTINSGELNIVANGTAAQFGGTGNINGGKLHAVGGDKGLYASYIGNIYFNLKSAGDSVYYSSLGGTTIKILDGCMLTDGTTTYDSSTSANTLKALKNTTLVPCASISVADGIEHGSITVPESAKVGDTVTLTVTPDEGYSVKSLMVSGAELTQTDDTHYTFTMPENDVTVTAEFEEIDYKLTANAERCSVSIPETAHYKDSVTMNVTPDTGCKVTSVTIDGNAVELAGDGSFTFDMPSHDVAIEVVCEQIDYKITATGEHCSVSIPETAHYQDSVTMNVTPDTGYRVTSVTVDGKAVEPTDGSYTFDMPSHDVAIEVVCEQIDYTITKSSAYGALFVIVNGTMAETAHYGDTVYVFASAFGSSSKLFGVKVVDENNNKIKLNGNAFIMPAGNVTVTAHYEHAVDLSALTGNYTAEDGAVLKGSTAYTVNIADGAEITLDNANITGGIVCEGSADITLVGNNTVTGARNKAGIRVGGDGTTLTIDGDGSLTANGGETSAGIGTDRAYGNDAHGGNVVINGGNINANGGGAAAGIGTGHCLDSPSVCDYSFGDIVINGGTVNAYGGYTGIGAGMFTGFKPESTLNFGNIYLNGGSIYASAPSGEAGGIGYDKPYGRCNDSESVVNFGNLYISTGIELVDASRITDTLSDKVFFINNNQDVTTNADYYFNRTAAGDRRLFAPKDNTAYPVNIDSGITHGTVEYAESAKYLDNVTVTVTPDKGYMLSSFTVKDSSGNNVAVDGTSFIMPKGGVTVTAEFSETTAMFNETTGVLTLMGEVKAADVKAFARNRNVRSVVCEEGTVLPADCSKLFYDFNSVETIDLSNADFSRVKDVHVMFGYCYYLTTIFVDGSFVLDDSVTESLVFNGAYNLTGGNGTSLEGIGEYNSSYFKIDRTGDRGYLTGLYTVTIPDYLEVVEDDTEHKIGGRYLKGAVIRVKVIDGYNADPIYDANDGNRSIPRQSDGTFDVVVGEKNMVLCANLRVPKYEINAPIYTLGGTLTVDKTSAAPGDTVTLTVTPDDGNYVKSVTVDGEELIPADGKYTFTMPEKNVKVTAEFDERVDISTAKLTANPLVFAYDGEEHTVSGALRLDGHLLVRDVDYVITGNTATEKGTYTLTAEGIGKYSGTLYASWKICDVYYVTATVNGVTTTTAFEGNTTYTLTSTGKGAWFVNGKLRSVRNRLAFTVLEDCDVEWRPGEDYGNIAVVNCSITDRVVQPDLMQKVDIISTWSLPEGATLVEAGSYRMYVAAGADTPSPEEIVNKNSKSISSAKTVNGTHTAHLTMRQTTAENKLCALTYVVYSINGDVYTSYSDISVSEP